MTGRYGSPGHMTTDVSRFSEKEVAKRELRKSSIHEAAHAAICFRFGGLAAPRFGKTHEQQKAGEENLARPF